MDHQPEPLGLRMSNAKYHAHPAISKSKLFRMSVSPAYFKYHLDNPPPPSPSLTFGSAFHKLTLEPKYFSREFMVAPKVDRRTSEGKRIWEAVVSRAEALNRTLITEEDYTDITAMRDAVMGNKYARRLLSGAQTERSFFWTDELTGVKCKCRPDAINIIGGQAYIIDLKSCLDGSCRGFSMDAIRYGYPLQAAMYREGVRICTGLDAKFIFICAEKDAPYLVNILEADDLFIRYGEDQMRDFLGMYKDCADRGQWYGYGGFTEGINTLSLPPYLQKDYV